MIGEVISDRYKIVASISESHMYEVFKALEIATGTTVVVKILKEEMAASSERIRCFSDEIRSFAGVSHPLVSAILDIDMFEDRPYVVTELFEGEDLHSWIRGETIPFADCVKIMQDLAAVLQYAGDQNITQRTIKLSNVLRNKEGMLKVLSFTHPRLKLAGKSRNSENTGVHSDLFFLGTTFYELLAGESPIRKRGGINELWDMKLASLLRVRHSALTPDQIEKVVGFVRATLTREMSSRFNSHEEFLKAIADLAGLIRGNSVKRQSRQLSMASQVVDALNGRMSNVNTAMPTLSSMPLPAKVVSAAPVQLNAMLAGDSAEEIQPGLNEAISGNLALAPAPSNDSDTTSPEPLQMKNPRRPALKLIKPATAEANGQAWQGHEEVHWLRNPVIFMGITLFAMIALIIFW